MSKNFLEIKNIVTFLKHRNNTSPAIRLHLKHVCHSAISLSLPVDGKETIVNGLPHPTSDLSTCRTSLDRPI